MEGLTIMLLLSIMVVQFILAGAIIENQRLIIKKINELREENVGQTHEKQKTGGNTHTPPAGCY